MAENDQNEGWIEIMKELRLIMEHKGYTQRKFADESGISQEVLSRIFSGKYSPTIRVVDKICKVLDVRIVFVCN